MSARITRLGEERDGQRRVSAIIWKHNNTTCLDTQTAVHLPWVRWLLKPSTIAPGLFLSLYSVPPFTNLVNILLRHWEIIFDE